MHCYAAMQSIKRPNPAAHIQMPEAKQTPEAKPLIDPTPQLPQPVAQQPAAPPHRR